MDKKIKGAEKNIVRKTKKEFKGLLKEDHKVDKKLERLETAERIKRKKK